MMKKLVATILALTVLAVFSVGYAEAKVDSPKPQPGTIFTPDENLEEFQRHGF